MHISGVIIAMMVTVAFASPVNFKDANEAKIIKERQFDPVFGSHDPVSSYMNYLIIYLLDKL